MNKNSLYDDFAFNSSPVADRTNPDLDFSIGFDMTFRSNDLQNELEFSKLSFQADYDMPSKGFLEQPEEPTIQQTPQIQQPPTNTTIRPSTPKSKRTPMVFKPFASFEATEITVQQLKNGLSNRVSSYMTRAQSLGTLPYPM